MYTHSLFVFENHYFFYDINKISTVAAPLFLFRYTYTIYTIYTYRYRLKHDEWLIFSRRRRQVFVNYSKKPITLNNNYGGTYNLDTRWPKKKSYSPGEWTLIYELNVYNNNRGLTFRNRTYKREYVYTYKYVMKDVSTYICYYVVWSKTLQHHRRRDGAAFAIMLQRDGMGNSARERERGEKTKRPGRPHNFGK